MKDSVLTIVVGSIDVKVLVSIAVVVSVTVASEVSVKLRVVT